MLISSLEAIHPYFFQTWILWPALSKQQETDQAQRVALDHAVAVAWSGKLSNVTGAHFAAN